MRFTLYRMMNNGLYIMSGVKKEATNYDARSHVVFYLNRDQIRQVDLAREIFANRGQVEDGLSTSLFIKTLLLDALPTLLRTISIEEMEGGLKSVMVLEAAREKLRETKRKKGSEKEEGG